MMAEAIADSIQLGREALKRHTWQEAFELLRAADASGGLSPPDLEALAQAAWWTAHPQECIDAWGRAYTAYQQEGNLRRAAYVATELTREYSRRAASSVAAGWRGRAERLLENEPESVEHGYLARIQMFAKSGQGQLQDALELARRVEAIGGRFGDRNLQALGIHDQGRMMVAMGQVTEGMALFDEATAAAVSGELSPMTTGIIYCNMINTCENLADYRRAGEWTEAAKRWCERQSISGFPGVCRVHRAEIIRLRGAWAEAEQEARRACEELRNFGLLDYTAQAFYEIGEIRLRMGDLAAAEEAFRQAHELGWQPEPGMSLLRLNEGKVESAATSIKRALADETRDRLGRARLLPAQVEISIAARDLATAQSAAFELEVIARTYGTPALEASALSARGVVQLVEGDTEGAVRSLRRGWQLWQEIDLPYEAAKARLLLGVAYRESGDSEGAELELQAAKSTFDRLGAVPDARHAAELLGKEAVTAPAPQVVKTFMFTDIVKSTPLVEAIGDEAWRDLLEWHDRTLRSLFATHEGEEIDHTGDGFFVAFQKPEAAIECAVAIQRTLADHRRTHGFSPQVRIGLHTASATPRGLDYAGKGIHESARIAALAQGEEILASQEILEGRKIRFPVSEPRAVNLKGISEPIQIVTIGWQ